MEGTAWLQDQTDDVAVLSGRVAVSVKIGLKTAVVPDGVAVLCNTLFSDQTALTEVQLPASLTHIGKGAFIGCNALERSFAKSGAVCWGFGISPLHQSEKYPAAG